MIVIKFFRTYFLNILSDNSLKVILICSLFLVCNESLLAQSGQVVLSNKIVNENGNKYYIHTIEPKQTLYAISQAYKVKTEEIIKLNPGIENGLKAGESLRIPCPSGLIHKVEKKQTIYGIAKIYNVSPDDIFKANPALKDGVKEGMEIQIPLKNTPSAINDEAELDEDSVNSKPVLNTNANTIQLAEKSNNKIDVNLFLPFYIGNNDSILNKEEWVETDALYAKTIPSLEYYYGFKAACDSMSKAGISTNINLYDVPADSIGVMGYFANNSFKKADCWVGPLHASGVMAAINKAESMQSPVFIPLAQMPKLLLGHKNTVKATPGLYTLVDEMCSSIMEHYSNNRYVVVHNNLAKEKIIADILKKRIAVSSNRNDSVREVIFINSGVKGLMYNLSKTKRNIIFVASNDQAFVTDFFNKLSSLEQGIDVLVVGLESWQNFENLDVAVLQKFNLHIPANNFVDYSDSLVMKFVRQYRALTNTEPGKYAFAGYDEAMFLLQNLSSRGKNFVYELEKYPYKGLGMNFKFVRTAVESGYENKSVFILRYSDFSLTKAY